MNVQITHIIVHEPHQAREIVAEARKIADEAAGDAVHWETIFAKACELLGQRYTFAAAPQQVQLPAMAIPGMRPGH